METLFITFMSIIIIFFVARLAVELFYQSSSGVYYNSFVVEIFRFASVVVNITMAIMLAVSLELMQVFTGMELKLTFYSLGTVGILYVIERVWFMHKNRDKVHIRSRIIDFKCLAKLNEFEGLISISENVATVEKSRLNEVDKLLAEDNYNHCKKSPNKSFVLKVVEMSLPIMLAIIILVSGIMLAK